LRHTTELRLSAVPRTNELRLSAARTWVIWAYLSWSAC